MHEWFWYWKEFCSINAILFTSKFVCRENISSADDFYKEKK